MKLLPFQKTAVDNLSDLINRELTRPNSKHTYPMLLKAPTGAGKTIILIETLKKICKKQPISVLWLAPYSLHEQSFNSFSKHCKTAGFGVELLEDTPVDINTLEENFVYFSNWESLSNSKNILLKDNEHGSGLLQRVNNAKKLRPVIVVADEAHFRKNAIVATGLLSSLNANILIDVTATPSSKTTYAYVEAIHREEVIEAGLIRSSLVINPKIENHDVKIAKTYKEIIDESLLLQARLKAYYKSENKDINPLILIQVPSSGYGITDSFMQNIIGHLQDHHSITENNSRLAIWLAEQKSDNLSAISKHNSKVDVLIFKTAIAMGWDCPRAQILCAFRELKSDSFKIQTIGRLLRQPFLTSMQNPALNSAYLLTNQASFSLDDQSASFVAKNDIYRRIQETEIPLPCASYKHLPSEVYLTEDIYTYFEAEFSKIDSTYFEFDTAVKGVVLGENILSNLEEITTRLNNDSVRLEGDILSKALSNELKIWMPVVPKKAIGVKYLKDFITKWSHLQYLKIIDPGKASTPLSKTQKYALAYNLLKYEQVRTAICNAVHMFMSAEIDTPSKVIELHKTWKIPPVIKVKNDTSSLSSFKKSAFDNFDMNGIESKIAEYFEAMDTIHWWLKNGDTGTQHFSIAYHDEENNQRLFFPDFIVKYTDNSYGIFEAKGLSMSGTANLAQTECKARTLRAYGQVNKVKVGIVGIYKGKVFEHSLEEEYQFNSALSGWDLKSYD